MVVAGQQRRAAERSARGLSASPDTEPLKEAALERTYHSLRRWAAVVAPSDLDPDDLVHEAWVQTASRRDQDPIDNLEAYLKKAILNLVRRHLRRQPTIQRVRRLLHVSPGAVENPSLELLDGLTADDRALLYLVDVERYSFSEAAELLGISTAAARKRASRARARLREWLDQMGRPSPRGG